MPRTTSVSGDLDARVHVLRRWVEDWRELVRDPAQLRLGRTPANLVVALSDVLTDWVSYRRMHGRPTAFEIADRGLHSRLAAQLRDALDRLASGDGMRTPLEYRLLERYRPDAVQTAQQLLGHRRVDGMALLDPLAKLAEAIENPMPWLTGALAGETARAAAELEKSGRRFMSGHLAHLAGLGTRALLLVEEKHAFESWPRKRLSAGALRVVLELAADDFEADARLRLDLGRALRHTASAAARLDFAADVERIAGEEWRHSHFAMVGRFLNALANGDQSAPRKLAFQLLRWTVRVSVEVPLTPAFGVDDTDRQATWAALSHAGRRVTRRLVAGDWVRRRGQDRSSVARVMSRATERTLADFVARRAAQRLLAAEAATAASRPPAGSTDDPALPDSSLVDSVEAWMREVLATAGRAVDDEHGDQSGTAVGIEPNEPEGTDAVEEATSPWRHLWSLSDIERQHQLSDLVLARVPALATWVHRAFDDVARRRHAPSRHTRFWYRWRRECRDAALRSPDAWEEVRWDRFDHSQFRSALRPLVANLAHEHTYDVVFPVGPVVADDRTWCAGRIVWYSPCRRSIGERTFRVAARPAPPPALSARSSTEHTMDVEAEPETDRPTAAKRAEAFHTWQVIRASTPAVAIIRAAALLEPFLSAASFALSVREDMTGYRPELGRPFFGCRTRGISGETWRFPRETRSDPLTKPEELERFSVVYAPLIERAVAELDPLGARRHPKAPRRRTPLEAAFLRGLFWYRSGRWQPDPVRRFLDHFIALEHLFADGRDDRDHQVADGVARIHGSWLYRQGPFAWSTRSLLGDVRALLDRIASDPSLSTRVDAVARHHRATAGWRNDIWIWLNPGTLSALADALAPEVADTEWAPLLGRLERLAEEEVQWSRHDAARAEDARFRIELLALRRHAIVHQALTTAPGIQVEADALTEIVEDVLTRIADDLLVRPDRARSMEALLSGLRAPWTG